MLRSNTGQTTWYAWLRDTPLILYYIVHMRIYQNHPYPYRNGFSESRRPCPSAGPIVRLGIKKKKKKERRRNNTHLHTSSLSRRHQLGISCRDRGKWARGPCECRNMGLKFIRPYQNVWLFVITCSAYR